MTNDQPANPSPVTAADEVAELVRILREQAHRDDAECRGIPASLWMSADLIESQAKRIRELEDERDAKKDAGRYAWLRSGGTINFAVFDCDEEGVIIGRVSGGSLDRMIDAAVAQREEG